MAVPREWSPCQVADPLETLQKGGHPIPTSEMASSWSPQCSPQPTELALLFYRSLVQQLQEAQGSSLRDDKLLVRTKYNMSRVARAAALVAEFEGGHSDASKHILLFRASACTAQWSWYIGAAGTGEGLRCLAAPPTRARAKVMWKKLKKSPGGSATLSFGSAKGSDERVHSMPQE
ncbi:hypothetical protein KCU81_g775, partial [Aureobasidium melanogenum]|uniref:Uncharacterized protein n=1 Tax=Aureobasidium melanogenum (strain CBS 110374) TaxID=1043003 RepID=A0A074W279_AURM1